MNDAALFTVDQIKAVLREVYDPEVPVLSVYDLGIIRDIRCDGASVEVTITPTYSGCPAMHVIEERVVRALTAAGVETPTVRTVLNPPWTTDWMTEEGKRRLKEYGIAPPGPAESPLVALTRRAADTPAVSCPFCESANTELRSSFGSTACKALYFCNACRQPFEHFKSL